jgi:DNA polymerase III subunit gamma/tau
VSPRVAGPAVAPTLAAPTDKIVAATPPREGATLAADSAMPAREAATTAPSASSAAPDIEGGAAADLWTALVQRLVETGAIAAMVRELALQAECVGVADDGDGRVWHLRVERENLRAPALRERLQGAATQAEGHAVRIEIEAGAAVDTPAVRESAERERRQAEAERVIHDDPLVRALMAQYKTARIVPGSVKPH